MKASMMASFGAGGGMGLGQLGAKMQMGMGQMSGMLQVGPRRRLAHQLTLIVSDWQRKTQQLKVSGVSRLPARAPDGSH